jgi:hypothetical protein
VECFTQLNGDIFALCRDDKSWENYSLIVLNGRHPFNQLKRIALNQLLGLESTHTDWSMTSCSESSSLFFADCLSSLVIHRVNVKDFSSEQFVECGRDVLSMSASNGRLTATHYKSLSMFDVQSLSVFDAFNGELLVRLTPDIERVLEAIETRDKTFFVLTERRREENNKNFYDRRVVEVDTSGHELKSFFIATTNYSSSVRCLSLAGRRLLVADFVNNRVLILSQNLKSTRTLIDCEQFDDLRPFSLNYSEATKQLIVADHRPAAVVYIFEWK